METTFTYDRQVSGKAFVGRLSERECLKDSLRAGENVALFDIPKTGKASLLRQSLLELSIEGFKYTTVEISLLSLRSTDEFLNKVSEALIGAVTHTQEEKSYSRAAVRIPEPAESEGRGYLLEGLREARQRTPMLLDLGGQPSERNETHLREAQVLLSRRPDYQAKHHPL